jgi:hypothetical protein
MNASKHPNTVQCAMLPRIRGIFQIALNRPGTQVASCTVLEMIETYSTPSSVYYLCMWKRASILASYGKTTEPRFKSFAIYRSLQ